MGGKQAEKPASKLTDPHLLAAQASKDELVSALSQRDQAIRELEATKSKLLALQADFRKQSVQQNSKWQSTATMYHDRALKAEAKLAALDEPVPLWVSGWAMMLYGALILLVAQWLHRRIIKIHGSYKKWLKNAWLNRPRLVRGGGAAHG